MKKHKCCKKPIYEIFCDTCGNQIDLKSYNKRINLEFLKELIQKAYTEMGSPFADWLQDIILKELEGEE